MPYFVTADGARLNTSNVASYESLRQSDGKWLACAIDLNGVAHPIYGGTAYSLKDRADFGIDCLLEELGEARRVRNNAMANRSYDTETAGGALGQALLDLARKIK